MPREADAFFTPGADRRRQYADADPADYASELEEAEIERRIQAVHCRLIEQATGGRLTFDGDRIVRRLTAAGESAPPVGDGQPQARPEATAARNRPRRLADAVAPKTPPPRTAPAGPR